MVDFNNEATIGVPAVDIEKISILQRRYDLIEAYEDYKKKRFSRASAPLSFVRARLISLFLEIQATLKRRLAKNEDEYNKLKDDIFNDELEEQEILKLVFYINEELDKIRLTRVDTQTVYNERSVEEENRVKGY